MDKNETPTGLAPSASSPREKSRKVQIGRGAVMLICGVARGLCGLHFHLGLRANVGRLLDGGLLTSAGLSPRLGLWALAASPSRRSKAHPIAAGIFHVLPIDEEVERAYDLLQVEARRHQRRPTR